MSGTQPSTFGNVLFNLPAAYQAAQTYKDNELLMQQRQQGIAANNTEVVARAAWTLLDPTLYPTEEARAAGWGPIVRQLKADGFAPNAPAEYPGLAHLQAAARMGTPSADLFKYGLDRQAKGAIAPSAGGTAGTGTGGTTTGGGGTGGDGLTGDKAHDLPLIAQRESGGNPTVLNYVARGDPTAYARGATASGKYQIVNSTWREGMQLAGLDPAQYATARDAPEQVQDKVASAIYDKYGNKPWQKGAQDWVRDEQGRYQMVTVRPVAGAPGGTPSVVAPGSPQAPPGVQMGGPAPPPPGGAPGAYPAYGGGMGAVIGQGVRPNIGGPQLTVAPPPVIRAQPIPAGGTASNADVIMGGVREAQATPLAGTQVAGPPMVASTQPTAAVPAPPVETPTPARYAGTAPAPSVEAVPQPGWGTGIGSGYGPQNALAPALVPPAPARPAVPATTATATQRPAADALPPLPAPTPPERRNNNGLTDAQQRDIDNQRYTSISSEHLQAKVDAYRTANDARAEKFQTDQLAYAAAVQSRQTAAEGVRHTGVEEQRQAEADKRAAAEAARQELANTRAEEDAARKRAVDADPIKGTDEKANADRLLLKYVDGILDGTATPAQRRLYAEAAQYYLKPQMQWIDDPTDPTKKQMVAAPGQLPEGFPHPSFKPGEQQTKAPAVATKTDFKPLPETERKQLIDTATRIDQETQQRNTFKPEYAGFGNAAIGEFANAVARNNPIASKADTARAEWWQNYQRYKLAVRQGISGQSLTASELGEFDKADIHPGMTAQAVRDNLLQQDKILRTAHERRVGSLAADRYSPDAIGAASGVDPTKVTARPLTESGASKPDTAPHPPGFKVIIP